MSGNIEIGPLTDDERDAGLGWLIYGNDKQSNFSTKQSKNKLVEIVAGLSEIKQVKRKTIRYILNYSLDGAINDYAIEEHLPVEYIEIAKQDNGLEILLKLFFKTKVHFRLTKSLVSDIQLFVKNIYTDKANDIVYARVSKVQKFIHNEIQSKYGLNTHRSLDKIMMREILSTARLHLEIRNLKYKNIFLLLKLREKVTNLRKKEFKNISKPNLLEGQKYVPLWRINHMKSLIDYFPSDLKGHITRVNNFDTTVSLDKYKEKVIQAIDIT